MGRTQAHRVAGHRGAPCFCFAHPAGQGAKGPHGGKGLAEELCAGLWRAHDFGGYVP